jgi:Leucine-rich repeat (LRR) protein
MSTFAQLEDLELDAVGLGKEEWGSEAFGQLTKLGTLRRLALGHWGGGLSDETLEFIKPLRRLEELDLVSTGHVTDEGLAVIRDLRELRVLKLETLGTTGLSAIEELPQLERLSIGTFVPTDRKADFSRLEHLKWLSLSGLAPGREIDIRLPPNLRGLELSEWWFRRKNRFNLLPALSQLKSLRLEFPARCAPDSRRINLDWLGSLPELRELTLDRAIEKDLMTLPDLPSLRTLELTGQHGVISNESLKVIVSRLPHLESLRTMTGWFVTDTGMEPLRKMTSLRRLELEYTFGLSEKGLASIGELEDLRVLHVGLPDESRQGPVADVVARIASLKELEELWLGGNLSDESLGHLASLKKLRSLDLTGCEGFTDEALASLMDELPRLTTLTYTAR